MKNILILFIILCSTLSYAQPNTEIFLFDIEVKNKQFSFLYGKNISNNDGYDNQPSFLNDNTILFASTRNGQTDIAQYKVNYDSKIWLNFTDGGEYSPLKIPNKKAVSAVRLDKDGKQRLYSYSLKNGESTELINDLVVAYYVWYNEDIIVSAVIDSTLNLVVSNLKNKTNNTIQKNVGRSFHKIPNTQLVSFISKENDDWEIKSLNPISGAIKTITKTLPNVEDTCWTIDGSILMGKGADIFKLNPKIDTTWKKVASLESLGIKNISRIMTNAISNKLLIAAEIGEVQESNTDQSETASDKKGVEAIIQKQLDAYNNRDIDGFMATYADDIKLYNYPNELTSEGQKPMRDSYGQFFENTPDLHAFIKSRIVIGNKVIDEEQVTINGKIYNAVAIYEVENGKIIKVTFIQ